MPLEKTEEERLKIEEERLILTLKQLQNQYFQRQIDRGSEMGLFVNKASEFCNLMRDYTDSKTIIKINDVVYIEMTPSLEKWTSFCMRIDHFTEIKKLLNLKNDYEASNDFHIMSILIQWDRVTDNKIIELYYTTQYNPIPFHKLTHDQYIIIKEILTDIFDHQSRFKIQLITDQIKRYNELLGKKGE